MQKDIIVMWDWDGCLVKTMSAHANLAAKCIQKVFELPYEQARSKYLATTGKPFDKQLEEIFTDSEESVRKQCAEMYHQEKLTEVYKDPANFPETEKTVKAIHELFSCLQFISSSTEEPIIEGWAKKNSFAPYFYQIYGREHGNKANHIAIIRNKFPDAGIIFVSDSSGDMDLPADYTIAVESTFETEGDFFDKGAWFVINGPVNAKDIIYGINEFLEFIA